MSKDEPENDCIVKLVPFSSTVDSSFWVKYCQEKLDTIQLSDDPLPFYPFWTAVTPRLHCDEAAFRVVVDNNLEGNTSSDDDGFTAISSHNERVAVHAQLLGYNSVERFQTVDKNRLLQSHFLHGFLSDHDPTVVKSLTQVLLLTYADLKQYRVVYWFAFPSFATPLRVTQCHPWSTFRNTCDWLSASPPLAIQLDALRRKQHDDDNSTTGSSLFPYFLIASEECRPLSKLAYDSLDNQDDIVFGFFDPTRVAANVPTASSSEPQSPPPILGWPLRNLVAYLSFHLNLGGTVVTILSYRPQHVRRLDVDPTRAACSIEDDHHSTGSIVVHVRVPTLQEYGCRPNDATSGKMDTTKFPIVGWELNARGKPGPRAVNLQSLLDTRRLAIQAADLNLKLMKWRMLPKLNVDLLQDLRVLVIGAGTLGCTVSRVLLGWGVRKFVIVDNSTVSYSNPVRQSLFTLEDCHANRPKAVAAAQALSTVAANVESEGHIVSIPMPGHPSSLGSTVSSSPRDGPGDALRETVTKLDAMVQECDVVFLLTDTRESRWLPTVMAAAHNKMLINAALGLDSWLVMRHGGGFSADCKSRLGCYFCNDVVAPENSTRNRTLDQQCTVTRPGLAPIASSMAVELMVALLHHPHGLNANPPLPSATARQFSPTLAGHDTSEPSSELGLVPHQIRGSLVSYTMMTPTVPAFGHCTACSRPVVDAYVENKLELVWKACESTDSAFLEHLTGLDAFRAESTAQLDSLLEGAWDDEDDE